MKPGFRARWLLVASFAALSVAGAWLVREKLLDATRERLVRSYQHRLTSLPELEAASLIQRLAQIDDQFLEIIVWASTDERTLVSATAQRELQDLVDQWSSLPPHESSVRAAMLARLLAVYAPALPAERRDLAHSLAERLILWPIDGRRVNTAGFIEDCQSVLLLPRTEETEIRIAAIPDVRPTEPAAAPLAPESPRPLVTPEPQTIEPSSGEPRPFTASPALRISDR
jgi:hypothetical protein